MSIIEARKIVRNFYDLSNPSEEDRFMLREALEFLIQETKDPRYMMDLGVEYYEQQEFDLALKYYEMAAEYNDLSAISGLGYIWYYGRTGRKDYEKAFYYYDKAREMGDLIAAYKVADMYKNGYYVEKDYAKYKEIIEELYPKVRDARSLGDPLPEVFTRLARIRAEEGRVDDALWLYDVARDFLSQRIRYTHFFGDLSIMKWLVSDVYKLRPLDTDFLDLYDLYEVLRRPAKVTFTYEEETHEVEAVPEDGQLSIRYDDKWFRTVDDFFKKAEAGGELLTTVYEDLYDFEVEEWN